MHRYLKMEECYCDLCDELREFERFMDVIVLSSRGRGAAFIAQKMISPLFLNSLRLLSRALFLLT